MPRRPVKRRRRITKAVRDQWLRDGMQRCIQAKKYLESLGYYASIGESEYNGRKHDLLGFADILAFCPARPPQMHYSCTVLVQVTTLASMHLRMRKISQSLEARLWHAEHSVAVFGYRSSASILPNAPTFGEPRYVVVGKTHWALDQRSSPEQPCIYMLEHFNDQKI